MKHDKGGNVKLVIDPQVIDKPEKVIPLLNKQKQAILNDGFEQVKQLGVLKDWDKYSFLDTIDHLLKQPDLTLDQKIVSIKMLVQKAPTTKYDDRFKNS